MYLESIISILPFIINICQIAYIIFSFLLYYYSIVKLIQFLDAKNVCFCVVPGWEVLSACPLVTILPSQQLSSAAAAAVAAAAGVWPPTSVDDMPHKGKHHFRFLLMLHSRFLHNEWCDF
jgi:hypothetical protein